MPVRVVDLEKMMACLLSGNAGPSQQRAAVVMLSLLAEGLTWKQAESTYVHLVANRILEGTEAVGGSRL